MSQRVGLVDAGPDGASGEQTLLTAAQLHEVLTTELLG
jgi:hypothetical protein